MRISPDKLNKLAHTVADTLAEIDEVGFLEDRNTIRQEARKALTALLTQEAGIDTAARLKIANQRKIITLPISLTGLEPGEAFFKDRWLHIPFDLNHHKKDRLTTHNNNKVLN